MKTNLTLLALFFGAIFFTGCSTYQYIDFSSNLPQDSTNEMVSDLDSVVIKHRFWEDNQMGFEVTNRSGQLLLIDKTRSFLIVGDESFPIWQDVSYSQMSGTVSESSLNSTISYLDAYGTSVKDLAVVAIPPGSRTSVVVGEVPYVNVDENSQKEKIFLSGQGSGFRGDLYSYNPENSPLSLRLYLTLYFDNASDSKLIVDESFWVAEVVKTNMSSGYRSKSVERMVVQQEASEALGHAGLVIVSAALIFLLIGGSY